jgi:hypothetical protein
VNVVEALRRLLLCEALRRFIIIQIKPACHLALYEESFNWLVNANVQWLRGTIILHCLKFRFLQLNNAVSANRSAQISLFIAFSYKNSSRYSSRFSYKLHQNKVFNAKITKNDKCVGTVRFELKRKLAIKR